MYKRVLIKISGEALAGDGEIIDFNTLNAIGDVLKRCVVAGVQLGIVIGGGNIWRGVRNGGGKLEATRSDHMGMLATTINCLALADVLIKKGLEVRVQTAITMSTIAEPYIRQKAVSHLEKNRVVIFGCGTGNPMFSTDTAAALRGAEINADIVLLAKNIDGVYDSDPNKNPNAKKYDRITYDEFSGAKLGAMDSTAATLSENQKLKILLFELKNPENIYRAIMGENIGTVVE